MDWLCLIKPTRVAGPSLLTADCNVGAIVFRATDEAAARTLVDTDPGVAHGVMKAELHPFRMSLLST